ncbi:hypothetical protein D3218_06785 [Aureimonas flava]|uniref:Putative Flp pilus-assembly TadG-like N-terminal domain-containing protein n=1 Tax=Aureimonas flava TaxID=2320271 RepID=A0A3A1WV72_9HYPH|nr:VWA domain-containing protein [Aureimonas flava]RIY02010.1 hypothetical protein D3218_06785 [Aureimonas flava]
MSRYRSFRRDVRGNVALVFALVMPVIVVTMGMAVDTSAIEASKWSMQRSLDAAALGAAKQYGRTQDPAELERWAQSLFFANEGSEASADTRFSYDGVTRVDGNNVLRVSAVRDAPTYFGGAVKAVTGGKVDLERWHLEAFSEVIVANRSIELALVLDNSGSMKNAPAGGGAAKIVTLREATKSLVSKMLVSQPAANAKDPVRISVVPFAASVNVGKDYASATWMDTKGLNPSHHDDLDWTTWKVYGFRQAQKMSDGSWKDLLLRPLTKFTIFEKLGKRYSDWAWAGCVMSRPNGYAITDNAPIEKDPSTLFVPLLAPSEYNWSGSLSSVKNDYLPDTGNAPDGDAAALAKQRDVTKYLESPNADRKKEGPNNGCTTTKITPLTATESVVQSAVRDMQPLGGTNIAEGLAWGWRTLTDGQPFPEGRPRNTKENLKVVVLMTDGENTYNAAYTSGEQIELTNANRSMFGTYGYGQILDTTKSTPTVRIGRMFDATLSTKPKAAISNITAAMNETMSRVCENIKKDGTNDDGGDGIVIFSIAFDLKDGSPIKERLRACASNGIDGKGAKLYYDAKNSNDLLSAFSSITDEISALRIAR